MIHNVIKGESVTGKKQTKGHFNFSDAVWA